METSLKKQTVLPRMNDLGFYEMRFESVGGLGANLAGQILAQSLVLRQGLNGAHFSSYGSEKKGSPVKSFVRVCAPEKEVRSSSPVERPHLLAIFHDCLLKVDGTTAGLYPDSTVVVNSPDAVEDVADKGKIASGTVAVVDALLISVQENTRINTAMLGAIVKAAGFINPEAVKESIVSSFKDKYPKLVEPNLKTFDRGYSEVNIWTYYGSGSFKPKPFQRYVPQLGYANAPIGGVITNPGNTAHKDLSASRQGIFPIYHRHLCIDCGLCTQTCPDYVFVWEKGLDKNGKPAMVMKGPNYQYCKGCLKCVEICPVAALTMECERPEFRFTGDVQLWGPPDALVSLSRNNEPAKWGQEEGYYWRRVS
ncbi:MAG: 2-oxoacid:acceptor oxidoreductase family protein [Chloroflexi bacterium]|nr:2-oxoacid:acceptor oxidoreductase family protein [Chloroflexota bacterium]